MATVSVFLNVTDLERALEFYQALGFKVDDKYGEAGEVRYADLSLDGAEVSLGSIEASDDPEFREWVGTPLGAGVLVYFTVDDVDGFHRRAVDAGAVVEHPPEDRPYGRVCTINDPDGYVLSFIREP